MTQTLTYTAWLQQRKCEGKIRYVSRRDAKRDSRRVRKTGEAFGPYWCEFCGCWHNGHRSAQMERRS